MYSCTSIAVVILAVVILLYAFPSTRSCVTRTAPWLALVTGGLAIGVLLMSPAGRGGVYGGASKKRRRRGGAEEDDSVFSEPSKNRHASTEIEALIGVDMDGDTGEESDLMLMVDEEPEDEGAAVPDGLSSGLGAYVVDTPDGAGPRGPSGEGYEGF
jgi:hypothetical protein